MKHPLIAAGAALTGLALVSGAAHAQCYEVLEGGESVAELEGYDVAALAAEPGLIPEPALSDGAVGIMCERDTVVPAADDFELIRYRGVPLMLRDGDGEDVTILMVYFRPAMENEDGTMSQPQYAAQLPQGSLSEDDRAGIVAAIEGFSAGEDALDAYLAAQAADEASQDG
jgi:hypothetical protein